MRICVVGAGYVGLVTGACLAEIGHSVCCVESDETKLAALVGGSVPIYEPGLDEIIVRNTAEGRLRFCRDAAEGLADAEVAFICVGTPATTSGEADLSYMEAAARDVAAAMSAYTVVVEKSTVPVHTGERVRRTISLYSNRGADFDVVSNPEFLREGAAVQDFLHPDRIVIGVSSSRAEEVMRRVYEPITDGDPGAPLIVTDVQSAELIKHASNSFLALKISYINAVARVCELCGANVTEVADGMGHDRRIGRAFLDAGIGYGGSCFPKDVAAFYQISRELGYDFDLLKNVMEINVAQRAAVVKKLQKSLWILKGKTIAILGLAFKPNTDDLRESPAIDIIRQLQAEGANIRACDPKAAENARAMLQDVEICSDAYETCRDADAAVLVTDWDDFRDLDLQRIKDALARPVFVDGRNLFDHAQMSELGFEYYSVGRRSTDRRSTDRG